MKYFSHYTEKHQTELFERLGVFFAFTDEQFHEKRDKEVKYVSLPGGMICPKGKVGELVDGLDKIKKQAVKEDVLENGVEGIIDREYWNYECQISYRHDEAKAALSGHMEMYPDKFTEERIDKVFAKCYKHALANDLF